MALCFTGGAALAAAMLLIIGAEIHFGLTAEASAARLRLCVSPPGSLGMVLRVDYTILWREGKIYRNGKPLRPKRRKKLRGGSLDVRDALRSVRRWVRIRELSAKGGIGIRADACSSVLLTGFVAEAIHMGCALLRADSFLIGLRPALGRDELCLNLEGILRVYPAQIIFAVLRLLLKSGVKSRTRQKTVEGIAG